MDSMFEQKLRDTVRQEVLNIGTNEQYLEISPSKEAILERLEISRNIIDDDPYSIPYHIYVAINYLRVDYPDLAAGSAYRALLLCDALRDEAEEYHDETLESMSSFVADQSTEARDLLKQRMSQDATQDSSQHAESFDSEAEAWLHVYLMPVMYNVLIDSLLKCGCFRTANTYVVQAQRLYPDNSELVKRQEQLLEAVQSRLSISREDAIASSAEWPDHGFVRREQYPWNEWEPNRLRELDVLNEWMGDVSSVLEVRAVELPVLTGLTTTKSVQLGVFAKKTIEPGTVILEEMSLLTANNRLQDTLCDACSSDLPELGQEEGSDVVSCPDCEVVFCGQTCFDLAMERYHPALCEKDVEAIAKDVPPEEAADSLYALLLLRTLAMAETQDCHPLSLREVRYIWGDFTNILVTPDLRQTLTSDTEDVGYEERLRNLPFSFEHNIRLPYHMLEKMDVDIFREVRRYDVWTFNTLYAKFRGTASARLSGVGGRAIRGPEVSAVHPMWCLANHSCEPNVRWEWGGQVKFWATENPIITKRADGKTRTSAVGIEQGAEILNHYCDIDLPVQARREWAQGALGGDCQCQRCQWESAEIS